MKKLSVTLLVLVLMIAVFAGCVGDNGNNGNNAQEPSGNGNANASEQPKSDSSDSNKQDGQTEQLDTTKPYKLVYVAGNDPEVFLKSFQEDEILKEKFPNLTIEYHQYGELEKLLASGIIPDIINYWGYSLTDLKEKELLGDVSDLIDKTGFDTSIFLQGHLDYIKTFGDSPDKLVALPGGTASGGLTDFAMIYNKDIFDKFGMDYPTDGMSLDEVVDLAKSLDRTEGGITYQGLTHFFGPVHWFKTLGLSYLNEEGKVDLSDPRWAEVFKIHERTMELGNIDDLWVPNVKFMKERNIAMHIGPITPVKNGTVAGELDDLNWDMVTFPHIKGNEPNSVPMELGIYAIPSQSKNREIAFEFLKVKFSKEYNQGSLDKVLNSPQMQEKNLNAIKQDHVHLVSYVSTPYEPQWQDNFVKILRNSKKNNLDVNTAIRKLEEELQKKIDELDARK